MNEKSIKVSLELQAIRDFELQKKISFFLENDIKRINLKTEEIIKRLLRNKLHTLTEELLKEKEFVETIKNFSLLKIGQAEKIAMEVAEEALTNYFKDYVNGIYCHLAASCEKAKETELKISVEFSIQRKGDNFEI